MEILNVGLGEMMIIAIIALLVFGPERLPEMAQKAGKAIRDIQAISGEFTQIIQESMAEVEEPIRETKKAIEDTQKSIKDTQKSITDEVNQAVNPVARGSAKTSADTESAEPVEASEPAPEVPDVEKTESEQAESEDAPPVEVETTTTPASVTENDDDTASG